MSLFPQTLERNSVEDRMESRAIASNTVRCLRFEGSFDALNSPQYLNFQGSIPEPKDSFFDRKIEDDPPAIKFNAKKTHRLPMDYGQDDIRYYVPETKGEPARDDALPAEAPDIKVATVAKTPPMPDDSLMELEESVIESVKTLGVNEAFARRERTLMATSTPFRVEGVQPMHMIKAERAHCTKTRPFSFEERNKQIQQRKAHQMKTLIQAEKEARKFRARPMPKYLKKKNSTTNSSAEKESGEPQMSQSAPAVFRAKSPEVLRRAPFKPILPKQHLVTQPFILHSELRAKERAAFDSYIKDKERLDKRLKELKQAAQKRREEEEIVKMRKAMVPKAQPIRKFKTIDMRMPKRPCTDPITPRALKKQRR